MPCKECRYFNNCAATLCPLDKNIETRIWFPDEEICKNREYANFPFVKTQKKIAKRTRNREHFYTFEMLNRNMRVTSAIKGIDPDKEGMVGIERWFRIHPKSKSISAEKRKELSERAKRNFHKKG